MPQLSTGYIAPGFLPLSASILRVLNCMQKREVRWSFYDGYNRRQANRGNIAVEAGGNTIFRSRWVHILYSHDFNIYLWFRIANNCISLSNKTDLTPLLWYHVFVIHYNSFSPPNCHQKHCYISLSSLSSSNTLLTKTTSTLSISPDYWMGHWVLFWWQWMNR